MGTVTELLKAVCVHLLTILLLVNSAESNENYRLPTNIVPKEYHLKILTNLAELNDNFTFSGDVAILVEVENSTDKITLHSDDLKIDEEKVRVFQSDSPKVCQKSDKGDLKVQKHSYDVKNEFYTIQLDSTLVENKTYVACIGFSGIISDSLTGYYKSSYNDRKSGKRKWLAVTQFESKSARMAFPCFDEPAFKAKFQITLGHHGDKKAISNMPLEKTEPIEGMKGWVWDHFQISVPMSTYLVAYVVSEMSYKEVKPTDGTNVTFRVWARSDAIDQVDYACEVGPRALKDLGQYYGSEYPLPKLDMVAVPDFLAGAMENWGLITFRETALLYDPKISSAVDKIYVAEVIIHELAHQWFGNLVTMRWWTDLWLNEGFATYVERVETNKLTPEWELLDEIVSLGQLKVLALDALNSSHPISVPIGHPDEIDEIFDTISYKKGSTVIRMMNLFLGEETFIKGVSNYLKEYAFGNAEQDDLWESLTEEAHKNKVLPANVTVKEIMDTWTLQTGFPLLSVVRNYEEGTVTISQERFFADKDSKGDDNTSWWIPITYTTSSEKDFNSTTPKVWLPKGQKSITIKGIPKDDWLVVNIKLAALCRVNYDQENLKRLSAALKKKDFDGLHSMNRLQILSDALYLARIGDLDYEAPLDILKYLTQEKDYKAWEAALEQLGYLSKLLSTSPMYGSFKAFMREIIEPIYNETSKQTSDKSVQEIKLERLVASVACKYNAGDCRNRAVNLFKKWMEEPNPDEKSPIPTEWRTHVYCNAISSGAENEWDFLWKRYLNSNVFSHRADILRALTCTREAWIISRYLQWARDDNSKIRKQDSRTVFAGVAKENIGHYIAYSQLTNNIESYHQYYQPRTDQVADLLSALASRIISNQELDNLKEFVKTNEKIFASGKMTVQQAIDGAKVNIQWHARHYNKLSRLFLDPKENNV